MESEHRDTHIVRNALVFSMTIIVGIVGYFYYTNVFRDKPQDLIETQSEKIEFGTRVPQGFPQDILTEADVLFEQSYSLVYPDQRQHTVVFSTTRSLEESQQMYAEYLRLNNWIISNESSNEATASFYATKEPKEMNVFVFFDEGTAKNMVSISVLEKIK